MKDEYELEHVEVKKGALEDLELPFAIKEVEQKEVLEFSPGKTLEEGIRECAKFSLKEGNYFLRGICKTTGNLEFIFGVCREDSNPKIGVPWFLTSENFKPTREFIRKSPSVIADMFVEDTNVLVNYIHKDNKKSIKWLKWLGFSFTEHPFLDTYLQFYKYKE